MTEETQNLVQEQMSDENVVLVGQPSQRSGVSCNKGTIIPALSVFVGLLIVGQAVTVYFVTQQQSQITDLSETAKQMKLKDLMDKLPGSPPSQKKKLKMASFNIPLAFRDTDGSSEPQMTRSELRNIAENGNKIEDVVKYLMVTGNPMRAYTTFNGSIMENMRKLRKTLTDEEWILFDSWMQQWFLFYLVQNTKTPEATPLPDTVHMTGAPVKTECQVKASSASPHRHLGAFLPECDEQGNFKPLQCWRSTGYCWCVYKNGTLIPGTKTRGKLDCSEIMEPEDFLGSTPQMDYQFGKFD
ncbi:HLA class II histocompatibility antigen gamma chain isoform X1 [Bombina bombina]|uniref:HLA class II histocompatibility antigen gamma chain isoform X1 n=1 Tax=Bombina bombina TaxID=8345 RepID=UPI00235AE076|nr:HLA class II histocompatibility antigen gamma chain isoform X1 [Bombina bombina]